MYIPIGCRILLEKSGIDAFAHNNKCQFYIHVSKSVFNRLNFTFPDFFKLAFTNTISEKFKINAIMYFSRQIENS